MVVRNFISILNNPEEVEKKNVVDFKSIINKYPYFQAARALHLKTLKEYESFKYNNELKITAAYATDRTVLFDFITAKKNNQNQTDSIPEIGSNILSKSLPQIKEDLNLGKPLSFTENETHSFNQWLQLAIKKPIIREIKPEKKKTARIIDDFIASSPKISRVNKTASISPKPIDLSKRAPQLMTETLAKVYLEQKKFENAIKAYEILSLKYPEKSGFFADQIKRIQIIQNNK